MSDSLSELFLTVEKILQAFVISENIYMLFPKIVSEFTKDMSIPKKIIYPQTNDISDTLEHTDSVKSFGALYLSYLGLYSFEGEYVLPKERIMPTAIADKT